MAASRSCLALVLVLAAGCGLPKRAGLEGVPFGHQELAIQPWGHAAPHPNASPHVAMGAAASVPDPISDVSCVLRNDRGRWEMTAPGKVVVALSGSPLVVECHKEGFQPTMQPVPCVKVTSRAAALAVASGGAIVEAAVLGALVGGAAAPLIALGALGVGGMGMAVASGAADTPPEQACDYSQSATLAIYLWPVDSWHGSR